MQPEHVMMPMMMPMMMKPMMKPSLKGMMSMMMGKMQGGVSILSSVSSCHLSAISDFSPDEEHDGHGARDDEE